MVALRIGVRAWMRTQDVLVPHCSCCCSSESC